MSESTTGIIKLALTDFEDSDYKTEYGDILYLKMITYDSQITRAIHKLEQKTSVINLPQERNQIVF